MLLLFLRVLGVLGGERFACRLLTARNARGSLRHAEIEITAAVGLGDRFEEELAVATTVFTRRAELLRKGAPTIYRPTSRQP